MIDGDSRLGNSTALVGHERAVDPADSVLWSRARAGDTEAFGVLFERHARTIYNYCFRRVGSWAVAEDLVSIVFLEAWRRVDKHYRAGRNSPGCSGSLPTSFATAAAPSAATLRRSGVFLSRARTRASRTTATSG